MLFMSLMHPDARLPNAAQQQKLCLMLHAALVDIRMLAWQGHSEQAADLADAFHNLPHEIWDDSFSLSYFRQVFLTPYCRKWPDQQTYDYHRLLDEVELLKSS